MITRYKKKEGVKLLTIEVPAYKPKRYKWESDREIMLDFRAVAPPWQGSKKREYKRRFNNPEHLQGLCNEYFESCNGVLYNQRTGKPYEDKDGYPVVGQIKPYTISGLALFLGVETEVLKYYELGKMDSIGFDRAELLEYSSVIKKARQRIEEYAEIRLYEKDSYQGSRFVLDNAFKWTTQKEQADIEYQKKLLKLREEEYKLKKETLTGAMQDEPVTITITRAKEK